jgi:hypothetical protein
LREGVRTGDAVLFELVRLVRDGRMADASGH